MDGGRSPPSSFSRTLPAAALCARTRCRETGIPTATIKRVAAELAHAAFSESIVIEQP